MVPPDSIPNSEVKRNSADGSVGPPHVRVGHRQASHLKNRSIERFYSFCVLTNAALQPRTCVVFLFGSSFPVLSDVQTA